ISPTPFRWFFSLFGFLNNLTPQSGATLIQVLCGDPETYKFDKKTAMRANPKAVFQSARSLKPR
ncbi:hypothetical protein, partial [Paenibacillus hemerocallicola]|uniref:hypothetical protein n=1 Tax=Paenibacillus hemerocallicola TaxID=1172614 RepID=UPI001C40608F